MEIERKQMILNPNPQPNKLSHFAIGGITPKSSQPFNGLGAVGFYCIYKQVMHK